MADCDRFFRDIWPIVDRNRDFIKVRPKSRLGLFMQTLKLFREIVVWQ